MFDKKNDQTGLHQFKIRRSFLHIVIQYRRQKSFGGR